MIKKEKGKNRNDSGIALNRLTESSENIYTFLKKILNVYFIGLFVLLEYGKTLFEAEERSIWRSCFVRYKRLNSSVIPRQSTSVPEEARAGHR